MTKLTISNAMRAGFNAADMVAGAIGAVAAIADMIKALPANDTGLTALRADIITGVIARDLYAGASLTATNVAKAQAVLAKAGKTRSETEARAEANGRKIWSRAMKAAGRTSSHGNAGNANAGKAATGKTATPATGKAEKPAKLPVVTNDKMTRAAYLALVIDTLTTLESQGKACDDVETAAIKEIETLRAKMMARAKIEK